MSVIIDNIEMVGALGSAIIILINNYKLIYTVGLFCLKN